MDRQSQADKAHGTRLMSLHMRQPVARISKELGTQFVTLYNFN